MPPVEHRVAVLMDAIEDDYQAGIVHGICREGVRSNVQVRCIAGGLVGDPSLEPRAQRNFLFDFVDRSTYDGVIALSAALGNTLGVEGFLRWLRRFAGAPLVSLGNELPGIHSVVVDNGAGVREVLSHLVEVHECRRIAFLRGPTTSREAEDRYAAYRAAMKASGLEVDPRLVLQGTWLRESGADAVRELIEHRGIRIETVDAIASANDYMALGALDELGARGILIPEAIALTGFDDLETLRGVVPGLTTVRQPTEELGQVGMQRLLALMGSGASEPMSTTLPAHIVQRRSCGCLQGGPADEGLHFGGRASTFETNLIENRALICADLSRSGRGALFAAGSGWENRLLAAFLSEVVADERGAFVAALAKIALAMQRAGSDASVLEPVLKTMRRRVLECAASDTKACARAVDAVDAARDTLAELLQRAEIFKKLNLLHQVREFSGLVGLLLSGPSVDVLQTAFAERLRAVGIGAFSLGLFTKPGQATETCVCLAAYSDAKPVTPPAHFRTRDFGPPELFADDLRPMLVQPLVFDSRPIGILACTLAALETCVYEQLREALNSGLRGYRLVCAARSPSLGEAR